MASGQKPRLSLPPELAKIDEGWEGDEHPTVPRPSRVPTSPVKAGPPGMQLTVPPPTGIELDTVDENDFQERATAVPKVPLDEYARRMMREESSRAVTEAPPPGDDDSLELDLSFSAEAPGPPPPMNHPSQIPTAPPPAPTEEESDRTKTLPEGKSPAEMEFDLASELPPAFAQPPTNQPPPESGHQAMKDKFAMGDFSGSLAVAEKLLAKNPSDPEARSLADKCREVLLDMYS